jgi:hypothetical protein
LSSGSRARCRRGVRREVPVDAFGERIAAAGLGCCDGAVEVVEPVRHGLGKNGAWSAVVCIGSDKLAER